MIALERVRRMQQDRIILNDINISFSDNCHYVIFGESGSGKASMYLKFSMILFVISLMLLSTTFLFVQQQYIQLDNDFVDNANTHLIKITSKTEQNSNITGPLKFSDEMQIRAIVENVQNAYTYNEYSIGFGISDEENDIYFVKGIDNEILKRFGLSEINPGEAIPAPIRSLSIQILCMRSSLRCLG